MAINLDAVQPHQVTPHLTDKIWLFYGEMATRKTSVACKFPKHVLFSYDMGYKLINGAMAVPMQNWSDFKTAVKQLDKQTSKDRFDVVIVDTIGQAYQACYNYVLTQNGIQDPGELAFGMGWKKIRIEFETVLRSITQKGYGLIMIAHSDEVEKEDKNTKQKKIVTKIDIDKRPDLIIKSLADFVLYLHKEPQDSNPNVPSVYAYSELLDIDTKSRSLFFSPRFEFTYDNLRRELEQAVSKQYAVENQEMPSSFAIENPYMANAVDFNELKQQTIDAATKLLNNGYDTDVQTTLLNVFKGQKLSEIRESEDNISKMLVVNSTFAELIEKARI